MRRTQGWIGLRKSAWVLRTAQDDGENAFVSFRVFRGPGSFPRHAAEDAAVPEVAEVGFLHQVEDVLAVREALEGGLGTALAREHDLLGMLAELVEEIRGVRGCDDLH